MDNIPIAVKPISLAEGLGSSKVTAAVDTGAIKEKKLHKACADFEAVFLYQMLKTMRKTVPASGLLDKMGGKDTYEMLTDQKVSEELAKKGGLGLQNVLFKQLSRPVR